ncbi:MAG: transcriptional repressor LexA [Parcubacteria group bacterium]|nr:transcriptional repressor LexA [Parcubacteria group bacterium]
MLTKRQKEVFDFVKGYQKRKGYSPALEEIRKKFKLASVSTAHFHISKLRDLGYLAKEKNKPRSINVIDDGAMIRIPLLGSIAAGQPIEAVREKETITIPKNRLRTTSSIYALRVVGDSMIDENIYDNDVVLVKHQSFAENGQKVVALINNQEATLKKFYKEHGRIRLQPANKTIEPIIIKRNTPFEIQGVVLDVIRNKTTPAYEMDTSDKVISPKKKTSKRKLINKLNDLTGQEWIQETISVFTQKGLGANHEDTKIERQHPAPFSFQDVGRLIKFFTKKGQRVLDPFSGVSSTLKACAVNSREGVGIELVKKYVDLTKERLQKELNDDLFSTTNRNQKIIRGDSLKKIQEFEDDYFDFIVTSPPYWNILNKKADHKVKQERVANNLDTNYSNLKNDLGNIDNYDKFIDILSGFFNDCSRILKPKKYLCVIVSDFRHKGRLYMFHSDLAQKLELGNFALKGITILYQRHKKIFPYGYPYSYVPNIHHQYILILQNKEISEPKKYEKK